MVSGFARFAVLAALVGLTAGCGGSPEPAPDASPSPDAEGEASPAPEDGAAVPPAAADFDAPLVPGNDTNAPGGLGIARLIAPTNPDARAREAEKALQEQGAENRDPFAIPLTISPSVQTTDGDGAGARRAAAAARPSPIAIPPQVPPIVTAPSPDPSASSGSSSAPQASESSPSEPAAEASPPGPPAPSDAEAVLVTGVVQVGNDYKIVVEVPGERTARYVSVGDRLGNGEVLVKRVELDELMDPIVVFEQYGQEVLKPVGEAPAEQVAVAPSR